MEKMANMEQEIGKNKGEIYKDYKESLAVHFMKLMDRTYQQREWVDKHNQDPDNWDFSTSLEFVEESIVEYMLNHFKDGHPPVPTNLIGKILKDEEEAKALQKVAALLCDLFDTCTTNEEFLASPYLPKLRFAAKEAFDLFMKNEKDNKEFNEFIETVRKNQNMTGYTG
jgi:hypothetical protein